MGNIDQRRRISSKLAAHRARRKEHNRREQQLRRSLVNLTLEARRCEPPISQDEIARLTGVSQPVISRIIRKSESPLEESENGR